MASRSGRPREGGPAAGAYDESVRRVLGLARTFLGMEVAWASQIRGADLVYSHVDPVEAGVGPVEGSASDLAGSYCVRVVDGRLPRVVPDARADPATRDLPATELLGMGAYVGVPVHRPDGGVRGMLCCSSRLADETLEARNLTVVEMLARILAELAAAHDDGDDDGIGIVTARVEAAIAGAGRSHVLQPIVDVLTSRPVGVEALARFDGPPYGPAAWFAEAEQVGLRRDLEAAAAAAALGDPTRRDRPGFLSVNLSPDVILGPDLPALLLDQDLTRVVVEITEHAPVEDYDRLVAVLAAYRAEGLRLAVDDAGAGYASFRHILRLAPDYIKIDLSLVRDIDRDPVRQALTRALVTFAGSIDAELIAEGVEVHAELDTLVGLGVHLMQGYLLCRPCRTPPLGGYPRPSPEAVDLRSGPVVSGPSRSVTGRAVP